MSTFWNYYFMRKYTENKKSNIKSGFEKKKNIKSKPNITMNEELIFMLVLL